MGLTRKDLFTSEQNNIAAIAKVFGHPARIAILQYMLKADECINSDLVEELGLAQATVSQHLKELKSINVIKGTIEGTSMCYCIEPNTWKSIKQTLVKLFDQHNCCNPNCC